VELPGAVYNATDAHLRRSERHRAHAAEHRRAAEALRAFEAEECTGVVDDARAACPLLRDVESVADVEGGARVSFDASIDINNVIRELRCHAAFAATAGREGMSECPLYLPGVSIRAAGDHAVDLSVDDPAGVAELRARIRTHFDEDSSQGREGS
jgi:hypothetical protein